MCVSKIGLSKVGEAVEDEDVAEVEGGVDLHQLEKMINMFTKGLCQKSSNLVGGAFGEEQLLPSHL